jgi:catechol 2,3-dioxygenase-like lactoylglutathione lyase family enzyme
VTVSLRAVHLSTVDPGAALAFYRDRLGVRLRSDTVLDGCRWITLVTESQPEVDIVLSQPHAGRSRASRDTLVALLADGELRGPSFDTDDLAATFDRIAATPGVEVLQEPITRPSGVRDIAVLDPAGNLARIEQRREGVR